LFGDGTTTQNSPDRTLSTSIYPWLLGQIEAGTQFVQSFQKMDGTLIAQEAYRSEQKTLPCPWQLDFITLRTNDEIARAPMSDNLLPSKE